MKLSKNFSLQHDELEEIILHIDELEGKVTPLRIVILDKTVNIGEYKGFRIRMRQVDNFDTGQIKMVYEAAYEVPE